MNSEHVTRTFLLIPVRSKLTLVSLHIHYQQNFPNSSRNSTEYNSTHPKSSSSDLPVLSFLVFQFRFELKEKNNTFVLTVSREDHVYLFLNGPFYTNHTWNRCLLLKMFSYFDFILLYLSHYAQRNPISKTIIPPRRQWKTAYFLYLF